MRDRDSDPLAHVQYNQKKWHNKTQVNSKQVDSDSTKHITHDDKKDVQYTYKEKVHI